MIANANVPYAYVGLTLLDCIFSALKYLVSLEPTPYLYEKELSEKQMNLLREQFTPFYELKQSNKKDAHLFGDTDRLPDRLPCRHRNPKDFVSRRPCTSCIRC